MLSPPATTLQLQAAQELLRAQAALALSSSSSSDGLDDAGKSLWATALCVGWKLQLQALSAWCLMLAVTSLQLSQQGGLLLNNWKATIIGPAGSAPFINELAPPKPMLELAVGPAAARPPPRRQM